MAKKVIALDAGHGMGTAGKRCLLSIDPAETREWYLNDRIADMVQEQLAAYDCSVLRVDDTTGAKDISLYNRVKAADDAGADIYISIHHNAGINGKAGGGTVVYYYNDAVMQAMAKRLYDAVIKRTGLVGNRSSKVAVGNYYVIRYTKMQALLLENGFMDSLTDTPTILTEDHAQKTAQGIVDFLVAELGLCRQNSPASENVPQDNGPYVTVNKGDSLYSISKKLGVSWRDIADINGIASPYTLQIGQKLRIPSKASIPYYPAYTGVKTTLAVALTSLGINSSYAFRAKIAAANNILLYVGTAAQNTNMYNLLVAGLLKRA